MGKGYSRENFWGDIEHFDEHGKKIGESRENFFGGYTNYDAKGNKIGTSDESLFGGEYIHRDLHGNKIGTSYESAFGGYKNYDSHGNYTGYTSRSILDELPPDRQTSGSLYRRSGDPPLESYTSSGGGYSSGSSGYTPKKSPDPAPKEYSPGPYIFIWLVAILLFVAVFNGSDYLRPYEQETQNVIVGFILFCIALFLTIVIAQSRRKEREMAAEAAKRRAEEEARRVEKEAASASDSPEEQPASVKPEEPETRSLISQPQEPSEADRRALTKQIRILIVLVAVLGALAAGLSAALIWLLVNM